MKDTTKRKRLEKLSEDIEKLSSERYSIIKSIIKTETIPRVRKLVGKYFIIKRSYCDDELEETFVKVLSLSTKNDKIILKCEFISKEYSGFSKLQLYIGEIEIYANEHWMDIEIPIPNFEKFITEKQYNKLRKRFTN